ncbi:MAG: hypothetical protein GY751_01140, partial [Bacteroidetes bacterium]|nr:hypothetical protein [Bacteroidota bacterium]
KKSQIVLPVLGKYKFFHISEDQNNGNGALLPFAVYGSPFQDRNKNTPFEKYFIGQKGANYFGGKLVSHRDLEYVSKPFSSPEDFYKGLKAATQHYGELANKIAPKNNESSSTWLTSPGGTNDIWCKTKSHKLEQLKATHYALIHSEYYYWSEYSGFLNEFFPDKKLFTEVREYAEERLKELLEGEKPAFTPQVTIDIPMNRVADFFNSKYPQKGPIDERYMKDVKRELPKEKLKPESLGFLLLWGKYVLEITWGAGITPPASGTYSAHALHRLSLRTDWREYYSRVKDDITPQVLTEFTNGLVRRHEIYRGVIGARDWTIEHFRDYILTGKNPEKLPVGATGYMKIKQNNIVIEIRSFGEDEDRNFRKATFQILEASVWLQRFLGQGGVLDKYFPVDKATVNKPPLEKVSDDDEKKEDKVQVEIPDFRLMAG